MLLLKIELASIFIDFSSLDLFDILEEKVNLDFCN